MLLGEVTEMVEFEFVSASEAEAFAGEYEDVCTVSHCVVSFDEIPEELFELVVLEAKNHCGTLVRS